MTDILTPIAPGELLDKITILQIKSERITDAEKRSNVMVEMNTLQAVASTHIPKTEPITALTQDLKHVNETLWDIEDDIRDCERDGDFGQTFIKLARSVYVTNDKRAALKREINIALGSQIIEEKSYADY